MTRPTKWARVALPSRRAVFGLGVADGLVVEAAPIARYTIGWDIRRAVAYFERRGATVEVLPPAICVHSGMTVTRCQLVDLCDCFDYPRRADDD